MSRQLDGIEGKLRQEIAVQTVADVEELLDYYETLWETVEEKRVETQSSGQELMQQLAMSFGSDGRSDTFVSVCLCVCL